MKGVQCYELFGGIALKNHAFSFFFSYFIFICNHGIKHKMLKNDPLLTLLSIFYVLRKCAQIYFLVIPFFYILTTEVNNTKY